MIHLSPDYVVFDLETTGISPYSDKVVEISAVDVEQLFDRFYTVETARHSFQKAKPAGKKD